MSSDLLNGIRILEVAEHTFVPLASAILADWGAEVVKIEHPQRGDAMRGLGQVGTLGFGTDVQVLVENSNRGKRSLGLDLADPDGLAILHRLIAQSDVFLTNKLPYVCEKLHITVDEVREHNPDIVYVRGSGYGVRGPDVNAGGYDFLGFWGRSGVADTMRAKHLPLPPTQPAPAFGDNLGAAIIAGGIATALLDRARTGRTHVVDVSLLATGMWALGGAVAISQQTGEPWNQQLQEGEIATPSNPIVGTYRTSDDRFIVFSALQGFHYWPEFCARLGVPEYADDPRFASDPETFMANAPIAARLVWDTISSKPLAHWREAFNGMKAQWAVAQDSLEVASDPQSVANGYIQDCVTHDGKPYRVVATPVQFDEEPAPAQRGPAFNEHGDAILVDDLGMDWDTVIDLKVRGVVA
jgi:crotonobetainyl-CoA:carnitine CoA-transferase CaiB-like acyl-CoA transferase